MKRYKNVIAILLCFFLVFGFATTATAQTTQTNPQAAAVVEETNFIQKMLEKLQQIINLMAKTGSITVKCIDENGDVILSEIHSDLKFGTYNYDAPEIEGYTLDDAASKQVTIKKTAKDKTIEFKYVKVTKPVEPETPDQPTNPSEKQKRYLLNPITYTDFISDSFVSCINGQVMGQKTYRCSNFIKIPSDVDTLYFLHPFSTGVGYNVGAFYDENQDFVIGMCAQEREGTIHIAGALGDIIEIKVPEGAKYIRVGSASDGQLPTLYCYTTEIEEVTFTHESDKTYTVKNVEELKKLDVKTGDTVITEGYFTPNDNGQAKYEIMTSEEWVSLLPGDVSLQKASTSNTLVTTKVDEYGNFTLANGLVARLVTDGVTTPEQWGAVGDGKTNVVYPFIHMFAQTKTGTINFKQDATYLIGTMSGTIKALDNPYRMFMCGGLLGGQVFDKPIMGNIKDVVMNGNNCLITIPDGIFGDSGMGILNFCGNIDGLEISGFRFDGKGRTIYSDNKNSNHTIFYSPGGLNTVNKLMQEVHGDFVDGKQVTGKFNNVNIHNNEFFDAGAMYKKAGDAGGDFILIINPAEMNNLAIEHNKFNAWGRWCLAIDLGGEREVLHNVKFNYNTCIGANATETSEDGTQKYLIETPKNLSKSNENYWRWRALGLIDSEAKKSYNGFEMIGNHINSTSGFALNGASGENKNFVIKDNFWKHCGGGYPYLFNCYSSFMNGILIENNTIIGPGNKLGVFCQNITIRNNTLATNFRTFGVAGKILVENNKNYNPDNFNPYFTLETDISGNIFNESYIQYEEAKKIGLDFKYLNNESGLDANFTNFEDLSKNSYMNVQIKGNKLRKCSVTGYGLENFEFDPSQFNYATSSQLQMVRGAHYTSPSTPRAWGGGYVNEGEVMFTGLEKVGVIQGAFYNEEKFNGIENFKQYNNYNWAVYASRNGIKSLKMVCTRSGYMPSSSNYGFVNLDTYYAQENIKFAKGAYLYTDDNLYYVLNDEKLSVEEIPTHTSGVKEYKNGLKLAYIGPIAKYKLVMEK